MLWVLRKYLENVVTKMLSIEMPHLGKDFFYERLINLDKKGLKTPASNPSLYSNYSTHDKPSSQMCRVRYLQNH